ncbi:hypothetical protein [Belliella pelovolcani]|uniref:Uncharacterized protein n=1 Tax=Belliella pelovolcani TaxID=529505 RepID=A0A1N7MQM5_9BACT|nr:hypothetical protein [Belliella pelovolcani]SIS88435.1 hypothetical protein SAMN05421761_10747 [Belliella pelovolcani]
MSNVKFYSPASPEELTQRLLEIGVSQKHINNHLPKYFWLINKIYIHPTINKHEVECRLSKELLSNIIGVNYYSKIINNLINLGIIIKSSNYSNYDDNKRSNGYSLIDKSNIKQYTFTDSSRFIKKLTQSKITRVNKDTLTLSRLYRAMSNLQYNHINQDDLNQNDKLFLNQLIDNPFQKVGQKGKRVYNNFCNLPKELREKLKLKDENLAFVDIVNSQMIFLAEVIKKYIINNNIQIDKYTSRFFKLIEDGKLYDAFAHWLQCDRKVAKNKVFIIIFDNNKNNKINQLFESKFPVVYSVIKKLKENDYKALAHSMQQEEADVIFSALDSIEYTTDVLTIHDSLYTNQSNLPIIKEALIKAFNQRGITATINVNDEYTINTNQSNPIEAILSPSEPSIIKVDAEPVKEEIIEQDRENDGTEENKIYNYIEKIKQDRLIENRNYTTKEEIKELSNIINFWNIKDYSFIVNCFESIDDIYIDFFNCKIMSRCYLGHKGKVINLKMLIDKDEATITVNRLIKLNIEKYKKMYNITVPEEYKSEYINKLIDLIFI